MSASSFVKLSETDSTGIIQLNRPEALNAINVHMFDTIYPLLKSWEHDKDIVIFKGLGKVFSSGGDIKEIATSPVQFHKIGYTIAYRSYDLIFNYRKPYIALMDGLAMGGASFYSVSAKYCVATERTSFSMPETAIGYFNDSGSTYFLSRLDNNFGVYMGMTGARVKGFDVKKLGLATHYIESHKLDEVEAALIKCKTNEQVDKVLHEFSSSPPSSVTELDQILSKVKKCFGGESVEKIYENLKTDGSDWAQSTLKTLNRMSPTSLKVVHRSFQIGLTLGMRDCFKMEFRLVIHHVIKSDMKEGVRAALFEKDFKPKWGHKSIYEVTADDVERFFRPSPDGDELTFETSEVNLQSKI